VPRTRSFTACSDRLQTRSSTESSPVSRISTPACGVTAARIVRQPRGWSVRISSV